MARDCVGGTLVETPWCRAEDRLRRTQRGRSLHATHQPPPRGHAPSDGLYPARFWSTCGCREVDTKQGNVGNKVRWLVGAALHCFLKRGPRNPIITGKGDQLFDARVSVISEFH